MYYLRKLVALLILATLTECAPQPNPEYIIGLNQRDLSAATTPSTTGPAPDCSPGGECDCSRIEDKESEEYVKVHESIYLSTLILD